MHFLKASLCLSCLYRHCIGTMEAEKKDRVSWQLEAAILDWVKSIILVTLHQQLRRDKRVGECLSGETPVQRERERENTADSVAVK